MLRGQKCQKCEHRQGMFLFYFSLKVYHDIWRAAIAQWICLPSRVRVPSTETTILSIYIDLCHVVNTIIDQKGPGLAHFSKKVIMTYRDDSLI